MTLVQELCASPGIFIQIFILLFSPYLCDSIALGLVLNGAVFIELYVIKFDSTSDMCFYQVLLFFFFFLTQNYILFYSPNLCDSNAYGFILNGAVFIELFTIYCVSISEPSKLPVLVILLGPHVKLF